MSADAPTASVADPHRKDAVAAANAARLLQRGADRDEVVLDGPPDLMRRDLITPYVWRKTEQPLGHHGARGDEAGEPLVNTGQISAGRSDDGLRLMLDAPSITPAPTTTTPAGWRIHGDPATTAMSLLLGVLADDAHRELSYAAAGPSLDRLTKSGVALASSKSEGNTKEATVEIAPPMDAGASSTDAADEASRIGLAIGADVAGPWTEQSTPFMPRTDSWDDWHLSTGPLLTDDPTTRVMLYNGATRDARWQIGWIAFDAGYERVVARAASSRSSPRPQPTIAARPTSPSPRRSWSWMGRSGSITRWRTVASRAR
ncbi:glycosidase [Sphingomonas sp. MMS24-JH45]